MKVGVTSCRYCCQSVIRVFGPLSRSGAPLSPGFRPRQSPRTEGNHSEEIPGCEGKFRAAKSGNPADTLKVTTSRADAADETAISSVCEQALKDEGRLDVFFANVSCVGFGLCPLS